MTRFRDPFAELCRQLDVIDADIRELRASLDRNGSHPAVSASHAVRRAELAQVTRRNLDWLLSVRDQMSRELEALLLEELAA